MTGTGTSNFGGGIMKGMALVGGPVKIGKGNRTRPHRKSNGVEYHETVARELIDRIFEAGPYPLKPHQIADSPLSSLHYELRWHGMDYDKAEQEIYKAMRKVGAMDYWPVRAQIPFLADKPGPVDSDTGESLSESMKTEIASIPSGGKLVLGNKIEVEAATARFLIKVLLFIITIHN